MQGIRVEGITKGPAGLQMNLDVERLEEGLEESILRLGIWDPPAVSLGRRQAPQGKFDPARLRARGLGVVVRPTGGLFILHHPGTITIHLLVPPETRLYREPVPVAGLEIARGISSALRELGMDVYTWEGVPERRRLTSLDTDICMAYTGASDILYRGLKVGAGALRKTSKGLLFQGYLVLDSPDYGLWAWIDRYPDPGELAKVFGGLNAEIEKSVLLDSIDRRLSRMV